MVYLVLVGRRDQFVAFADKLKFDTFDRLVCLSVYLEGFEPAEVNMLFVRDAHGDAVYRCDLDTDFCLCAFCYGKPVDPLIEGVSLGRCYFTEGISACLQEVRAGFQNTVLVGCKGPYGSAFFVFCFFISGNRYFITVLIDQFENSARKGLFCLAVKFDSLEAAKLGGIAYTEIGGAGLCSDCCAALDACQGHFTLGGVQFELPDIHARRA